MDFQILGIKHMVQNFLVDVERESVSRQTEEFVIVLHQALETKTSSFEVNLIQEELMKFVTYYFNDTFVEEWKRKVRKLLMDVLDDHLETIKMMPFFSGLIIEAHYQLVQEEQKRLEVM